MEQDKPLRAVLFGVLAGIPAAIYTQLMKCFQLTTVTAFKSISMMWVG